MKDGFIGALQDAEGVVHVYPEDVPNNFKGTVIDIETVGVGKLDDITVGKQRQVILGIIGGGELDIFYVKREQDIDMLLSVTLRILCCCDRPFYAFNCWFEHGVWKGQLGGLDMPFDGELQQHLYEPKRRAVEELRISNYDDPFFDKGAMCIDAWLRGDTKQAVAHNRACLLKERDILLKRGSTVSEFCGV